MRFTLSLRAIDGWTEEAKVGDAVLYGEWRRDTFTVISGDYVIQKITATTVRLGPVNAYARKGHRSHVEGFSTVSRRSVYRDRAIVPANHPAVLAAIEAASQAQEA